MNIDEVVEDALFDYCKAMHERECAIQDRIERGLRAAIEQHVAEAVKVERLAIIMALPGGTIADPQQIADMIRARGVDEEAKP